MMICRAIIAVLGLALIGEPVFATGAADGRISLNIVLSAQAAKELKKHSESIVADAVFDGDASPGSRGRNEVGRIDLARARAETAGVSGPLDLAVPAMDPAHRKMITGPVHVNVNIYSGRRSSPDNILGCDFVDAPLKDVMGKSVPIQCGLLSERPLTRMRP